MQPRPAWWKRAIAFVVIGSVQLASWGLALAMFVTGAAMFHHWRILARQGVALEAAVERCRRETTGTQKGLRSSSGGSVYYACDYTYAVPGSAARHGGYFQSSREWQPGETVAIRYRADAPHVSATETNLAHPEVTPVALMALPVFYAGYQLYRRRRAS